MELTPEVKKIVKKIDRSIRNAKWDRGPIRAGEYADLKIREEDKLTMDEKRQIADVFELYYFYRLYGQTKLILIFGGTKETAIREIEKLFDVTFYKHQVGFTKNNLPTKCSNCGADLCEECGCCLQRRNHAWNCSIGGAECARRNYYSGNMSYVPNHMKPDKGRKPFDDQLFRNRTWSLV